MKLQKLWNVFVRHAANQMRSIHERHKETISNASNPLLLLATLWGNRYYPSRGEACYTLNVKEI